MDVQRIAAFTHGDLGGNPAGVVLCSAFPSLDEMQRTAKEVGFSETVFASPRGSSWRVRYFAPEREVPFCGHATIALGAALTLRSGPGVYALSLNHANITVEGKAEKGRFSAALQSPHTASRPASREVTAAALQLFTLQPEDLDTRIPTAIASAGEDHLVLALRTRQLLREMAYNFEAGKQLMLDAKICTMTLVHAESDQLLHVRNPFASGGVYEDAATGAAAAALAGLLRDISWPHGGYVEVHQGDDMGVPSRLHVHMSAVQGSSIRVSGTARLMR